MKKLFKTLAGAALLLMAACTHKTPLPSGEKALVQVDVSIQSQPTKAYSDGLSARSLTVLVYARQADGSYLYLPSDSRMGTFPEGSLSMQMELPLLVGGDYRVVFVALHPDSPYTLDTSDNTRPVLVVPPTGPANDERRDGFWACETIRPSGDMTLRTELHRPFAQLNFLSSEVDFEALEQGSRLHFTASSLQVAGVPDRLDLFTGAVWGSASYALSATMPSLDDAYALGDGAKYIGMNYLLAPAEETPFDMQFSVYCSADDTRPLFTHSLSLIPLRKNWRTNIKGSIFSADSVFSIEINPAYNE